MAFLNLNQVISYGGSYQEHWDSNYRLSIEYYGQKKISLLYDSGIWKPAEGEYPALPMADEFFQQAANASVAAQGFVASGLTARDLPSLCPKPCKGPIFSAECLRILMDQYGLQLETVYPYVLSGWTYSASEEQCDNLYKLQPRTCQVLNLLQRRIEKYPAVIHDARIPEFRNPGGAVTAGERVRLAFDAPDSIQQAELELYSDNEEIRIPMQRMSGGWEAEFAASEHPGAWWYRFCLKSDSSPLWVCTAQDGIHAWLSDNRGEGFRLTVYAREFETPTWFQQSVMYQVFPDRYGFSEDGTAERGIDYHRSIGQRPELHHSLSEEVRWKPRRFERSYLPDDFYGGTLNGIRQKLPELRALGISCLYLNPIFEARSNHRYDTSDYLKIDPILGTNEDFEELCREAKAQGIRILCDGVFSHTGADSIYFNRDRHYPNAGACQNEPSPYDSWYDFRSFPNDYRSWWGFRELPEVDENDPGWQDYIITGKQSVIREWLRHGASGWRLDVADELPDEVLQMIRRTVKEEDAENVLLGEVWEDAVVKVSYGARRTYALGSALDSVMNYPFRTAVLDFLKNKGTAFDLSSFLTSQQMNYPAPMYRGLMNLLGSHDVERLQTALAVNTALKDLAREKQLELEAAVPPERWLKAAELSRLAFLIAFSIPGVPCIYYGDELGMTGTNDPFNRRPYGIHAGCDLKEFLTGLARRRNDHPALKFGEAFFMAGGKDVLLILRRTASEAVLTAVNRAEESRTYEISVEGFSHSGKISAGGYETVILPQDHNHQK